MCVLALVGCGSDGVAWPEYQPPGQSDIAQGDQPVPGAEVYSPTPDAVAESIDGVAVAVEQVRETGRVRSQDVKRIDDAIGPIINPLTGGWFSAIAAIGFGILQRREARKRGELLQAVEDDEDTPSVVRQVSSTRPDLAERAGKLVVQR